MQSDHSSVVTCKEQSSHNVITSTARQVHYCSVQVCIDDLSRPTCRTVSVADAAVEVGESLLASSSQRHNCELADATFTISLPAITSASVQCNPLYCVANTNVATVLSEMAISLQNRPRCQTLERTDRDADSNHMSESSPFVVISRDESTSPWCQLSCDERNSSEKLMETSGPLDNLAQSQSQASLYAALQVHVSVIMSLSVTIS